MAPWQPCARFVTNAERLTLLQVGNESFALVIIV
jgi:hypothetical protein